MTKEEKAAAAEAAKAQAAEKAKVKVYAPNKQYSGVSAGVRFVDGEAEVDGANVVALNYLKEAGYHIGKRPE